MTNYNIEIRKFNGTDYDVLYPVTVIENIDGLSSILNTKASLKVFSFTLRYSDWVGDGSTTPYTQQLSAPDVISTNNIVMNLVPSSNYTTAINQDVQFNYINYATALNNAIKFTCLNIKPTIDLPVKILVFG